MVVIFKGLTMKESFCIYGHLDLKISKLINGIYVPTKYISGKNQILNNMLGHVIKYMNKTNTDEITKISFGTNNETAKRTDTQTTMTDKYTKLLNEPVSTPEYNKVEYKFSLLTNEHNGYDITEYALTLESGEIVTRIIRGKVEKKDDIRIDGTWTITVDVIS